MNVLAWLQVPHFGKPLYLESLSQKTVSGPVDVKLWAYESNADPTQMLANTGPVFCGGDEKAIFNQELINH